MLLEEGGVMKKWSLLILALLIPALLLIGCGYNAQDLQDAYNQGRLDAAKECKAETPSYSGPFVGSINSDIYHYPWCQWAKKILPENEVWFNTAQEARDAGYRPCKVCNPPIEGGGGAWYLPAPVILKPAFSP
jgi:hypothetical protein